MSETNRPNHSTILFGGSFDPPHCAHVMVVSYLLSCTDASEVWVVPCFDHALGAKRSLPFEARIDMCRLAFAPFGQAVRVIDVEARLPRPSYSVDTVRHLTAAHPDRQFRFAVGTDIWNERHRWKEFDALSQLAPLVILARQGAAADVATRGPQFPAISATAIREDLRLGRDVSDRVPCAVLDLIRRNHWYERD